MSLSHHTMVRVAKEKQLEYLHEAELHQLLQEARKPWRHRLADVLVSLASHLNPNYLNLKYMSLKNVSTNHDTQLHEVLKVSGTMSMSEVYTEDPLCC
ncbi:MAG: hypothetical protein AAF708_17755 [Deinococcota bacterium]